MSIAVKSGLPSLGSTEGAVITKDDISVTEETSPSASAGEDLPRGKSAYEIAKENGFNGTETEWLASLKGEPGAAGASGKDGENGKTPYVGDNGNWYIGADDTGKPSRGAKGDKGEKGEKGDTGAQGIQGEKGDTGAQGPQGAAGADGKTPYVGDNGNWFVGSDDTGKPSRGEKGEPGSPGAKGDKGDPGATPNLTIGSVTTLDAGQNATASMGGTAESPVLNLGIPRGAKGEPGESGGGTDISLGLTSATVGQTIKVKAVDDTGKPTTWEAADFPSGGGGGGTSEEFILLAEVTLEEDVKTVTLPLSSPTKHFITRMWCPKISAASDPTYINIGINGNKANLLYYLGSAHCPSKDNKSQCTVEAHGLNDGNWAISAYTNFSANDGVLTNYDQRAMIPIGVKNNGIMQAESVIFDVVTNDATQYFPVGSILRVWGV